MEKIKTEELFKLLFQNGDKVHRYLSAIENQKILVRIFSSYNNKDLNRDQETNELKEISHFFKDKIKIMIEIVSRMKLSKPFSYSSIKINNSQEVYTIYKDVSFKNKDSMHVVMLNIRYELITMDKIEMRDNNPDTIDKKEIFRLLIKQDANYFVLVHYHTEDTSATPTMDEISFTSDIKKISDILDFKILDHIVIGEGEYFSYQEKGLL